MFKTISEIKEANVRAGRYYFSPDTMAFFNSEIESNVLGGRFFVTSEKGPHQDRKFYTVREANDDGTIDTASEFQQFMDLDDAIEWALSEADSD